MPVPSRGALLSNARQVRPTRKLQGGAGGDVASSTITTTTTGSPFTVEDAVQIDAQLAVTAISGSGATISATLQTDYGDGNWVSATGSLPAQTAVGAVNGAFVGLGTRARWVVTVAGTSPSVTYSIDHQARTLF